MPDAITIGRWNEACRQENNRTGSSFVDTNAEDWTDWYFWQPLIGEITHYITCRRPVLPAPPGRKSVFPDETRQCNKLYGNKPPPRQYQQMFSNSSL